MVPHFTCPNGHQWEALGLPPGRAARCPFCDGEGGPAGDPHDTLPPQEGLSPPADSAEQPHTITLHGQAFPAAEELPPPRPAGGVPGYRIERVLGQGGYSRVFQACHLLLQRAVALKVFDGPSPLQNQRFVKEVQLLAHLHHQHIVPIYEIGEAAGQFYYTMMLLQGGSLDQRLRDWPRDWRQGIEVLIKIAEAVHHAHEQGILHCDIKPRNIIFDLKGEPFLIDFSISGLERDINLLTTAGSIIGTPAYMAPEMAAGGQVGPTADVYGLGTILYEMLTGTIPFQGNTVLETLQKLLKEPPDRPRRRNPACPPVLEAICLQCLHKDPRKRPASARILAEQLRAFQERSAPRAPLWSVVSRFLRGLVHPRPHSSSEAVVPAFPSPSAPDIISEPLEAELYQSLIHALDLLVFRKDLEGRLIFVNRPFCAALNRRPDQILGRTDFDLFSPELALRAQHHEQQVHHDERVVEYNEEHFPSLCQPGCRCQHFRGPLVEGEPDEEEDDKVYFQILLAPVREDGRLIGVQGALRNITRSKRAEHKLSRTLMALEEANAELARSNKDLEAFAYVASHDLQEPLRMVASFTKLLQKRYQGQLDSKADEYIHFAADGATRMQGLINDLLTYSRVGSRGKPLEETGCEEAFHRAVSNLQLTIRESDALVSRTPLPRVKGDATQLVQLFQNLIVNALKFRGEARPAVHVSARRDGGRGEWVFVVRDNGIGIEARHLERIFVIFQRLHTQKEYPGSGIGLAICRKIVERHGGRIWVESQPGKGSVFSFTLPAVS